MPLLVWELIRDPVTESHPSMIQGVSSMPDLWRVGLGMTGCLKDPALNLDPGVYSEAYTRPTLTPNP